MKAKELLRFYEAGRRDFSGENLRGQNFKEQNLSGADFSHADIRGANFTKANLKGTSFKGAKAGLQHRWAISLVIFSYLLSAGSGIFSGYIGTLAVLSLILKHNLFDVVISAWGILIVIVGYFIIMIRKGIVASLGVVAITVAISIVIIISTPIFTPVPITCAQFVGTGFTVGVIISVAIAVPVSVLVAIAIAVAGAVTSMVAIAIAVAVAVAVAVIYTSTVVDTGVLNDIISVASAFTVTATVTAASAGAVTLVSAYIGWRALRGDARDAWTRTVAIAFAAIGGTSFRETDLTDADFAQATLKSTDLRDVTITRTSWHQAKKLDRARLGGTILLNPDVRDLLVTHRGANNSYVECNFKGANLAGVDLSDANLRESVLIDATLERAWLERANLTKTQALNTNFHQANLTGACLEDWSINSATQLEDANCDYVYLLSNQQERRPSSGNFAPGEFTKLFEEVLDTIDLIFRNGVDWKAFVTSFKQVQVENEDTELTIQSIENKGDGVVVVKVQASPEADKEKIHSDFTRHYDLTLKAVEERYKAELQAKDEQIEIYRQQGSDMKEIVGLLASRPINVDVKATADSKAMQRSSDQSRKIEIGDVGGDFNASGSALNLGDISGTVTNTINQLPSSADPNQPGIKELLTQLQEAIATESTLNDGDKAEALEQVKALAEAGQNPGDGTRQKLAKRATRILKGIIDELPTAAKLAEACSQLLPAIASLLSL